MNTHHAARHTTPAHRTGAGDLFRPPVFVDIDAALSRPDTIVTSMPSSFLPIHRQDRWQVCTPYNDA
ncbi:MAG: hypothetical protein J0M19_04005 [Sphingomonadales bacterium]|nr:hypothetical protein [Sphingomonadales bacterium]